MSRRVPNALLLAVPVWRRLGAYLLDLIIMVSPLVVFLGLPKGSNWGAFFALVFGVGSCVPLFLVLQGVSVLRYGRTLGMAYFGLELGPSQPFGKRPRWGLGFFSGVQLLFASFVFGMLDESGVGHSSSSTASTPAWVASAVFALVVVAPNLLSILVPGHRSLAERFCRTRSVESNAVPSGISRAERRGLGYVIDFSLFALPLVPGMWLASSIADAEDAVMALLPELFTCGVLLVFELWALFSARDTIGTRALCSVPQALDARSNPTSQER